MCNYDIRPTVHSFGFPSALSSWALTEMNFKRAVIAVAEVDRG